MYFLWGTRRIRFMNIPRWAGRRGVSPRSHAAVYLPLRIPRQNGVSRGYFRTDSRGFVGTTPAELYPVVAARREPAKRERPAEGDAAPPPRYGFGRSRR